jgi:hypothetical protein
MDYNKRRGNAFERVLAKNPELYRHFSHFFEESNQPRETCLSVLG